MINILCENSYTEPYKGFPHPGQLWGLKSSPVRILGIDFDSSERMVVVTYSWDIKYGSSLRYSLELGDFIWLFSQDNAPHNEDVVKQFRESHTFSSRDETLYR